MSSGAYQEVSVLKLDPSSVLTSDSSYKAGGAPVVIFSSRGPMALTASSDTVTVKWACTHHAYHEERNSQK